jgi:hypothetical protein
MRETVVRTVTTDRPERIRAEVTSGDRGPVRLFMESNYSLATDATPWCVAAVPVAMAKGEALRVQAAPVDPRVVANCARAQALLVQWYPDLATTQVTFEALRTKPAASGVGCFLSCGVDSFYSVFRNRDRITHLIFVSGFDVPLVSDRTLANALEGARSAASVLGLPLIEVRTNLRELSDGVVSWQDQYHGTGLAAVAHALSDHIGVAIIPSAYSQVYLRPCGSHPDLDPWWSGQRVGIEHGELDISRPEKVWAIAEHQVVLDHLRVCLDKHTTTVNCGRCEKCVRTMFTLDAVGVLDRATTFPHRLTLRDYVWMIPRSPDVDLRIEEFLEVFKRRPPEDPRYLRRVRGLWLAGQATRPLRGNVLPVAERYVAALRERDLAHPSPGKADG